MLALQRYLIPLLFGVVMGAIAVGLSGCGITPSPPSSHNGAASPLFTLNLGTEPPTLDPTKAVDLTSYTVIQNLMKGLVQFGPDMAVQPAVAKRWDISPDRLTYTFYLDKAARWHDGAPVTAQHFLDGWQRALTPATGADYAFFLYELAGAKAFYQAPTDFSTVKATALNAHTLQVTLARPIPFFLDLMAAPIALPARLDVIKQYGDQWTEPGHFVGNGPYQLAEWKHEDHLTLSPNPNYHLNNVATPTTTIEMVMVNDPNTSVVMYENNELDLIETTTSIPASDVRRLQHHPDAHLNPIYRLNYIGFNTQQAPFNNPLVRQAFAHATDRSWFEKLLQSGQKANATWLTPGLFGYNPDLGLAFNPAKAKALLKQAGYGPNNPFPTVALGYATQNDTRKEMEILQYQWQKHLGVTVTLQNMEWKMFLKQLQTQPPGLYRLGWFVDYPDADSFLALFTSDSGNNYTGWQSHTYDTAVKTAAITANGPQRQQLMNTAQRQLLETDTAIIPLYTANKLWLAKPHVNGLVISPLNLIDLQHVRINRQPAN